MSRSAQAEVLDFGESFDVPGNPRTPAAPISLSQSLELAQTRWPGFRARPRFCSPHDPDFVPVDLFAGYDLLGMEPYPHNVLLGILLEEELADGAKRNEDVVVVEPRRASKTTGIWAVLLGRCQRIPRHKVAFTAQSGVKASEIFTDIANELENAWSANHSPFEPKPFKVRRQAAHESIEFTNGSWIRVYPPDAKSFRSAAADTVFIDEAQEHDPAKTIELIGAILPLMDTKPSPQIIVSGTPGVKREGMLWDSIEQGRKGEIGILEYSAPDDADVSDPDLWATWHPGIGTLTTHATIAKRFAKLPLMQFEREYCCRWPVDVSAKAIDPALWEAARIPWHAKVRELPAHIGIGFDIAPDQSSAAIAVAWRDDAGDLYVEVLAHEANDAWIAKWWAKYGVHRPGQALGFDSIGNNINVANELDRLRRGRPKLVSLRTGLMAAATARVYSEINAGTFHHFDQPSLNVAADGAGKRTGGGEGQWFWARRASKVDIQPLVAATAAVHALDSTRARRRTAIRSATRREQA